MLSQTDNDILSHKSKMLKEELKKALIRGNAPHLPLSPIFTAPHKE